MAELDAADWSQRDEAFEALRVVGEGGVATPGMTLSLDRRNPASFPLVRAWRALPSHPNMLEMISDEPAVVRFAVLDWGAKPPRSMAFDNATKVARVFAQIVKHINFRDWVWFLDPRVSFDLRGEPRVWWQPVELDSEIAAPEAKENWLTPTEKMLVFALGRVFEQVGLLDTPKGLTIANRCLDKARARIRTIDEVLLFLDAHARPPSLRNDVWDTFECGVGWLACEGLVEARTHLERVLELEPNHSLAQEALRRTNAIVESASLELAQRLESDGWWGNAGHEYRRCRHLMSGVDYHLALARCAVGVGKPTEALVFASRAVVADPSSTDAYRLVITIGLRQGHFREVIAAIEELAARAPASSLDAIAGAMERMTNSYLAEDPFGACFPSLVTSIAATPAAIAAPVVERLIRLLPANSYALDLCKQLLAISPEHGGRATLAFVHRAELQVTSVRILCEAVSALPAPLVESAWLELVDRIDVHRTTNGRRYAREAFAVLLTLPLEQAARPICALIGRVALGSVDDALDMCERLFAWSPQHAIEGFSAAAEAAFQAGELAAAMRIAESMITRFPTSGLGHYRRGRCLFSLGRLVEARDTLDRAQVIEPALVDAMILRREVDRALGKVKAVVGSAFPQQLAIPEHLLEVRAAMARGSVPDAVSWLEANAIGDGSARLLLGNLLIGQERYTDAMRAFEQVAGALVHAANVGKARALAAIGRGEEALRILDRVVAEDPESTEAMVVRAKVVALLR